jgi:hypothetical protein
MSRYDETEYLIPGWMLDHFESAVRDSVIKSGPFHSGTEYFKRLKKLDDMKNDLKACPVSQSCTLDSRWRDGKKRVWLWAQDGTVYSDLNLSNRFIVWEAHSCEYCKAFAYRYPNKRLDTSYCWGEHYEQYPLLCCKCRMQEYKAWESEQYG